MKKKVLAITLATVLALSLGLVMARPVGADPDPTPVGWWHFDEGTGLTAGDSSGNGNDGTLSSATWETNGKFNGALDFDGSSSIVTIPDNSTLDLSAEITVEAWIKANSFGSQNGIIRKALYLTETPMSWGMDIQDISGVKKARFFIYDEGTYYIAYSGSVSTGVWHHLVGTYDGSTVDIYLDGSNAATTPASHTGDIDTNNHPITIGKRNGDYFFDGIIDEVIIWDEARAPNPYAEITSPDENAVVFGSISLDALYYDDDPAGVNWAARRGQCAPDPTMNVMGNVGGLSDPYTWDGYSFHAEGDTSSWTPDQYYFVFNPVEGAGELDVRICHPFWVGSLGDLSPTLDYNPVCTEHTVSVSIGVAVAGVEVHFDIDGPNSGESGFAITGGDGIASFTYHGVNPGTDVITAYIDLDGEDDLDVGEPTSTNTATKYWLEHFVTGGGNINTGRGKQAAKITFGGNVGFDLEGNEVGQWNINFHNVNNSALDKGHFHTTEITSLAFSLLDDCPQPDPPDADYNKAIFKADGKFNGEGGWSIEVRLVDYGEPGKDNDAIMIFLSDGAIKVYLTTNSIVNGFPAGDFDKNDPCTSGSNRHQLDGGNLQIHPPPLP